MSSRRLLTGAAVGLTAALSVGTFVAAPADAADTPATTYLCSVAGQSLPLVVTPTAAVEIPPLASGFTIPAGSASIGVVFTVPEAVLDGLAAQAHATQVGVSTSNFGFRIGNAGSVPVSALAAPNTAIPEAGDLSLPASGPNGAFQLPAAGTYNLLMPAGFDVVVSTDTTGSAIAGRCTLASGDGPVLGSMTISQQDSTTTATGPKKAIKAGKPAKISVKVAGAFKAATGKVTAKEGSKSLGSAVLKKGKATFSLKNLKPGAHTIVVSYGGDKSTKASQSSSVLVLVTK